ncbi:MAG TPA: TOBE domain-containing protein [Syntrophorhabdales bacterium]|nr:TOBE domain-containing protein [Syntrophorhabdales bacterium]
MKLSARNVFWGVVAKIKRGAVNSEVVINLESGTEVTAIITNGAVANLGLKEGMAACAVIKATYVIVGTNLEGAKLSTRNVMKGKVVKVVEGPVSTEVDIDVGSGNVITAVITLGSARSLGLKKGGEAYALFKASSVIVGVK